MNSRFEDKARVLAAVVLIGLAVRLLYLYGWAESVYFAEPLLDQKHYVGAAEVLAGQAPREAGQFDGFRSAAYPALLALVFRAQGSTNLAGPIALQLGLGVLNGCLTALLAMAVFRRAAAGLAAGLLFTLAGPV